MRTAHPPTSPTIPASRAALTDRFAMNRLEAARRIVVKVGSTLVTDDGRGLDRDAIARWAAQLAALRAMKKEVVLVSSGAIAEGIKRLGWIRRPTAMHELQAAAAVGQMGLVQAYESGFAAHGIGTAQVLLTHADLADRSRYLNARSTLLTLLGLSIVPIINENDTVVTDEIKFGDNDTLGALVANLIEADALVILTDQAGLFSADPRRDPAAHLIAEGRAGDPALEAMAGGSGSAIGRGGMLTKILAARRAANDYQATGAGYLRWLVDELTEEAAVRSSVPLAHGADVTTQWLSRLKDVLLAGMDDRSLTTYFERRSADQRARPRFSFPELTGRQPAQWDERTRFRLASGRSLILEEPGDGTMQAKGLALPLEGELAPALRKLSSMKSIGLADLASAVPPEKRTNLRRCLFFLMQAGLLFEEQG